MNHDHVPACAHATLAFCARCDTAYCKDCKFEWKNQSYTWTYYPNTAGGQYWPNTINTQTTMHSNDAINVGHLHA